MSEARLIAVAVVLLGVAGGGLAAEQPVAVSPGGASKVALIGDGCPTFSWGAVEGARRYELLVYRLVEAGEEAKPTGQRGHPWCRRS